MLQRAPITMAVCPFREATDRITPVGFLFKVHDDDNDDNWRVWDAKNRVREVIKCKIKREVRVFGQTDALRCKKHVVCKQIMNSWCRFQVCLGLM